MGLEWGEHEGGKANWPRLGGSSAGDNLEHMYMLRMVRAGIRASMGAEK